MGWRWIIDDTVVNEIYEHNETNDVSDEFFDAFDTDDWGDEFEDLDTEDEPLEDEEALPVDFDSKGVTYSAHFLTPEIFYPYETNMLILIIGF